MTGAEAARRPNIPHNLLHQNRTIRTTLPSKLRKTNTKHLRFINGEDTERTNETAPPEEDACPSERSKRGTENQAPMAYLQGLNALANRTLRVRKRKIDEEESPGGSKIVPRMVFTKLDLETSEHPLFKRIWRFKHIINQDSPLLTSEAQKAIMDNDGNWPRQWNNHKAVRKAIRFNQMVVSFTGISNISGGECIVGAPFLF